MNIPTFYQTCPACREEFEIARSPYTGISDNLPEACDHCGHKFTEQELGKMLSNYDDYLREPIED